MIYVAIPAYNPNEKLYVLCSALIDKGVQGIVLVNDGSEESVVFERLEADFKEIKVLTHRTNKGKGEALKTAFRYVLELSGEIFPEGKDGGPGKVGSDVFKRGAPLPVGGVKPDSDDVLKGGKNFFRNSGASLDGVVTADADGQHKAEDIIKCMNVLRDNPDAFVLGCRTFDWVHMPLKSRIGNKHTIKRFRKATGVNITDTQTGLRGLGKDLIREAVFIDGSRFEYEMSMLTRFAYRHKIIQVPIQSVYSEDSTKRSLFRPFRDSFKVVLAMRRAVREEKKADKTLS